MGIHVFLLALFHEVTHMKQTQDQRGLRRSLLAWTPKDSVCLKESLIRHGELRATLGSVAQAYAYRIFAISNPQAYTRRVATSSFAVEYR